jgi:hypothetical protein
MPNPVEEMAEELAALQKRVSRLPALIQNQIRDLLQPDGDTFLLPKSVGIDSLEDGVLLELADSGTQRRVAFGSHTNDYGASPTGSDTVTHGLGTTPTVVLATAADDATLVGTSTYTATDFTAALRVVTGANLTTRTFSWVAIG